jgi:signal transduction histidine kinase
VLHQASSWELQRAQLLVFVIISIVGFAAPSIILYYYSGAYILGHLSVLSGLFSLLALIVMRRFQTTRSPSLILIYSLFGILYISIPYSGGVFSPLLTGLFAPSIFALLFLHRREMVVVFICELIVILGFTIAHEYGVRFPTIFASPIGGLFYGFIGFSVIFGAMGGFYFTDLTREVAYSLLEKERDSVQEKVNIATRTLEEQQVDITRINEHLEGQNAKLQEALALAEKAKHVQEDFLRNVSHEVRTPLSAILGFTEIVQDRIPADDEATKQFVQQIEFAGQNLMDIFSNILALSALESSLVQVQISFTLIPVLFQDLEKFFRPQMQQKGLQFRCTWTNACEEGMYIDARHTREIMRHLLSNALKFTSQGSVSIHADIVEHSSYKRAVLLSVQDTGIGIASELQSKIFEAFHQTDGSKNRDYGGLGLGLAITERLANAMQGRVWVESELGKGTTFFVEIPVQE